MARQPPLLRTRPTTVIVLLLLVSVLTTLRPLRPHRWMQHPVNALKVPLRVVLASLPKLKALLSTEAAFPKNNPHTISPISPMILVAVNSPMAL